MFDALINACANSETYPLNIIRKKQPNYVLRGFESGLKENAARLFVSGGGSVEFLEAHTGVNHFEKYHRNGFAQLKQHYEPHFGEKEKDPRIRQIFVTAGHSRAPLKATLAMFQYICSYHQISPLFCDLLYSFGRPKTMSEVRSQDFHYAAFHEENHQKSTAKETPELGRSGWELRNCYQLQGLEKSDEKDNPWRIRPAAIYHSCDMSNGRSFWLLLKANDVIRDRIAEQNDFINLKVPSLDEAFTAALMTHLLALEWCAEGWRWYINEIEGKVRGILKRAKATTVAGVDSDHGFTPEVIRSLSAKTGTKSLDQTSWAPNEPIHSNMDSPDHMNQTNVRDTEKDTQGGLTDLNLLQEKHYLKQLEILKGFPFSGVQTLNSHSSKLEELKLAMTLNMSVASDLREYYKRVYHSANFPEGLRESCEDSMTSFQQRVKSVERCLELECLRATTLISLLDDGKRVYDSILQFRNTEVNNLFALGSQRSSNRMESSNQKMERATESMHEIARKTERDTSSMHIITFFTLIFLPGTFLGSFFSTPIFDREGEWTWTFNRRLFILFMEICLPMMAVTIIVWGAYMAYKVHVRRMRQKARDNNDNC